MSYHQQFRVRYGECDMQGVVFNAHYLAYCDDAVDTWLRQALPGQIYAGQRRRDVRLHDQGRLGHLVSRAAVRRARRPRLHRQPFRADELRDHDRRKRGGEPSFTTNLTYVSVEPGTHRPCPVPDHVRVALSG